MTSTASNKLHPWKTLVQSWKLVGGTKWATVVLLFVLAVISMCVLDLASFFTQRAGHAFSLADLLSTHLSVNLLVGVINYLIFAPFIGGLFWIGLQRVRNEKVKWRTGFSRFHQYLPITATLLISWIITGLPQTLLLHFAPSWHDPSLAKFLFLVVTLYSFILNLLFWQAVNVVMNQSVTPWCALWISAKTTYKHFFGNVGILILFGILFLLSAVLIGIGIYINIPLYTSAIVVVVAICYLWLAPMSAIATGLVYQQLFEDKATS